jgi:hypothetical protein
LRSWKVYHSITSAARARSTGNEFEALGPLFYLGVSTVLLAFGCPQIAANV